VLRLLRKRDFALLISGQAVSDLGDGMYAVALAWRVYQSYSTPAALSVVGIAFFVPRLLVTIAGGVLSDRFERRWTMIGADCGRAVAVSILAAISLGPHQELLAIVVLVAFQAIAGSLFGPAESALLPQLVSAEELGRANSLRTVISPLASAVLGPAVGGAIIASAGSSAAFWVDAGTYVVSVVTLLFMRSHRVTNAKQRRSVLSDARQGFAYVAGRPWLWGPILTASIAQLLYAGPNQALVPYLVKFELHASASALGVVLACGGLGTVAAGLLTARLPRPRAIVTFMILGWTLGIGSIAIVGLAQSVWQAALGVFIWNLFLWSGEILWLTLLGLTVPNHIRGRVSSIDFLGSYWMIPLSMALTGPIAALIGPRTVLVWAGIGGATAILSSFLVPNIRRPKYLEENPAVTT
jgi:MFS family permease